ncbi:MAG: type IV pilus twitching motility protein PilT [Gammaproteobacteria bacterium]|nr:type IV pilus twitching motility protein PilT [Gammaproteobacteria bacterium]
MAVDIAQLLAFAVENNASDLHLSAGVPPMIRVDGDVKRVNMPPLTHKEVHSMVYDIMNDKQRKIYEEFFETDFSFEIPNLARFRVNAFNQNRGAGAVFRNIPSVIKSLDDLHAPKVFKDLCMLPRGLVLVTGPTGSGKSTTLAGMIDYVNVNRPDHIITIEDPIEFVHESKRSLINQREVGLDTRSFSRALRAAMRAAPDVILIGEIRDRETMESAIALAGTGHLAIATLHANNCAETLDRIINLFPRDQHAQIFLDLSQYLRAIVSQRLVRGRNKKRVAAVEVMLNTPHIQDLIKRGDVIAVKEAMQSSNERGIQKYDTALLHLYREGKIDIEEALNNADSRTNLEARINFG